MSDAARQLRQADEFVRRLTAAVRANQLYAPSHPLAGRALKALAESAAQMLVEFLVIGLTLLPARSHRGDGRPRRNAECTERLADRGREPLRAEQRDARVHVARTLSVRPTSSSMPRSAS